MVVPLVQQLEVAGKRVLVRVDFNVPLTKEGAISDDSRIKASLPTIQYLIKQGAKVILLSHLGRPDGQKKPQYTLKPCAARLSQLLKQPVHFASDCLGDEAERSARALQKGEVLLLENVRFYPEEEAGDKAFAEKIAQLGDLYINDAFGTAHRAHATTAAIASFFPGKKAAGFLLQKEIEFLGQALLMPQRPFYALVGGSKVSSKLGVLQALVNKSDKVFVGGAMAYTFLKAQGISTGSSLVEEALEKEALSLWQSGKIFLPLDHIITDKGAIKTVEGAIPQGFQGVDIGPQTIKEWKRYLQEAKTIFWNGPLGIFEDARFAIGTNEIAKALTESSAITIVGGGDSVSAIENQGLAKKITHLSTGGGASLEYIEKGSLPGIICLE